MPVVYYPNILAGRTINIIVVVPKGQVLTAEMINTQIKKEYPRLGNIQVTSLEEIWYQQTLTQRLSLWVIFSMTGLTLLLAAIGVAGLTQMTTNHQKYELAMRMAMGAKQTKLVSFILKDAISILLIGLGLGFIVSVFGYHEVKQQLDMLPNFNWIAMLILDFGLVVIVLLSVIFPAWKVITADPMHALRQE